MVQIPPDKINERWDTLSPDLRDFILSESFYSFIRSACESNSVLGMIGAVHDAIELRLYGFMNDNELLSELSRAIGPEKGDIIMRTIMSSIPEPIKNLIPEEPLSPSFSAESPIPPQTPSIVQAEQVTEPSIDTRLPETTAIPAAPAEAIVPVADIPPLTEEAPKEPPVQEISPETIAPENNIPVPPPAAAPMPAPAPAPAPFILHQETETRSVIESSPEASRFSPLRPEFYTPNLDEMRETKPSFARLQFGSSSPAAPAPAASTPPQISPATPASSGGEIRINPSFSDKEPVPENNVVNLKDLPL